MNKQIHFVYMALFMSFACVAQHPSNILKSISPSNFASVAFTQLQASKDLPKNPQTNTSELTNALNLDANSGLAFKNFIKDNLGYTHYRYVQTYNSIPIENSLTIIHSKEGAIASVSANMITKFARPRTLSLRNVTITPQQAVAAAIAYVKANKFAWQDSLMEARIKFITGDGNASYYPIAHPVYYSTTGKIDTNSLVLAYKIDIFSIKPFDRKYVYVNVKDGSVLGDQAIMSREFAHDTVGLGNTAYYANQTILSTPNSNLYILRDSTRGVSIITLHGEDSLHPDYISQNPDWALARPDQYALDAHFGASQAWLFYHTIFGRNSIDDQGATLLSWVNDPNNTDNAAWNGSAMDFGMTSDTHFGITTIDIVGHEMTHGITQNTCALLQKGEPGDINESLSDIMGKSIQIWTRHEDTNWLIGNAMNLPVRQMNSPKALNNPATYKGTFWYTGGIDDVEIHTNCTVGDYMFYLLVNGGSGVNDLGNEFKVTGIGLLAADSIIYRTQTVYLVPNSQYSDWRTWCVKAAIDLYGENSPIVNSVENAWYAVGVGQKASD